jgi:hypothetical protein
MRENLEIIDIVYLIAPNFRTVSRMGQTTLNVDISIFITLSRGKTEVRGMERMGSE